MDLREENNDGFAPHALYPSSLPYRGDLDAARKARDIQAIRILTQLRDRGEQKLAATTPSSGGHALRPEAPAAFSIDSLTRSLLDMGFTLQQAELAAQQYPEDKAEAVRWLMQAAADSHSSSSSSYPTPPPRRGSPPAVLHLTKAGGPPLRSATALASPTSISHHTHPRCSSHGPGCNHKPTSHASCGPSGNTTSPRPACVSPSAIAGQQATANAGVLGTHEDDLPAPVATRKSLQLRSSMVVPPSGGVEEAKGYVDDAQRLPASAASVPLSLPYGPRSIPIAFTSSSSSTTSLPPRAMGLGVNEDGEVEIEDPILMTKQPISQMHMVDCRCSHWFSHETLYFCIKTALGEDLIPACPLANHPDESQRCNYLLTQKEVEQVLNKYKPPSQLPAEDRRVWRFHRGKLVDGKYGWLSERVTEAFLRKGKIDLGCIECPTGGCGYWVEPSRPREKQRMDCPKCLSAFCSLCKRPYHYRCACDEVMTITKQWLEWQQHGREPYLIKMAAEDNSYQSALDVFNTRRAAHNDDVRTAERNWDLLVADENYKASRCRRCPHCHRVIERIDGCDTMVCGQNAHGGNIQNGCGQAFNWNEAGPYFADIGTKSSIKPFKETPPAEISRVRHFIMDSQAVKCDHCQANIQGPLATCINCPSFHCCIRCQNKHTRGHVLRLYFENTDTYT